MSNYKHKMRDTTLKNDCTTYAMCNFADGLFGILDSFGYEEQMIDEKMTGTSWSDFFRLHVATVDLPKMRPQLIELAKQCAEAANDDGFFQGIPENTDRLIESYSSRDCRFDAHGFVKFMFKILTVSFKME